MTKTVKKIVCLLMVLWACVGASAQRTKYNFNLDWKMVIGEPAIHDSRSTPPYYPITSHLSKATGRRDSGNPLSPQEVTLPHALNENEAFRVRQNELTDTIAWYYKTFTLDAEGKKAFIEFEGVRMCADVYVNGQWVGYNDNGVMAFGFDITPYIKKGENEIAVRVDSRASYVERSTGVKHQWNDMSFNANYGGINKNVNLYVTPLLYQTLPLYSNLGTTGTYVYASNIDVPRRKATVNIESQVKNESTTTQTVGLDIELLDMDGHRIAHFTGKKQTIAAGATATLTAQKTVSGLHFWSVGYGYLYTVHSALVVGGSPTDVVTLRTGFRKTRFADGKIWLNDRVLMVKGFAQRSTNEWPAVGMDQPAWMSDLTNRLMVEGNANTVRWMHVTPSKQEVESCDRVGLIQAMPAGDHEGDCEGRQWEQRVELMRDAIIYNRNNPSILFYEGGNESISREHMVDLINVRNEYDPHGGRAMGSREMLDIQEAEYGGEMLYINKSRQHPVWAMEYCRDEGYRLYWDEYSYPWHQDGNGPYLRKAPVPDYNHNQDKLTLNQVKAWYDFWRVRPGMGERVSSGGVKICFTETNTYGRSELNYRVSGTVDAMRIEKDGYKAHQVMWNGWVENDQKQTYIIGHWNYQDGIKKDIHVVSTSPMVELFVNGKSVGKAEAEYDYLHTIKNVAWEKGTLKAVGLSADGTPESEYVIKTAGEADHLVLSLIENPTGTKADGNDIAIIQVEVVDKNGRRCPLENRFITFTVDGPGEWLGGIAKSQNRDNFILDPMLPVECGVNRVMVRSTRQAGRITVHASAKGLAPVDISFDTQAIDDNGGLSTYFASDVLPSYLENGETIYNVPSYHEHLRTIPIESATAGYDAEHAHYSYDDNELSEWKNDGKSSTAWITYTLKENTPVDQIDIKFTGWRRRSYPIEIWADQTLIWKGTTEKSLGYVHLFIKNPVRAKTITIKQTGAATTKDGYSGIVEVAQLTAGELDLYKTPGSEKVNSELRIVEIDFLQNLDKK